MDDQTRGFGMRAEMGSDGNTLVGFASVFDTWYDVHDHMGVYRERFKAGSYRKTLRETRPACMFDHGQGYLGGLPLGPFKVLEERAGGLYFEVPMHRSWIFDPVREAVDSGAISGCSVRFSVPDGKDTWSKDRTERTIHEARLFELGPVVMPASTATSVALRSFMAHVDRDELAVVLDELRSMTVAGSDISDSTDVPEPVSATRGAAAEQDNEPDQQGTTREMDKARRERLLILRGVKNAKAGRDQVGAQ